MQQSSARVRSSDRLQTMSAPPVANKYIPGLTLGGLGGLSFHLYGSLFWTADPTQSAHERALELASEADFERKLHYMSNRIRSLGSLNPQGPGGPKIVYKLEAEITCSSSQRCAHIW